jgi:hypothetical protein
MASGGLMGMSFAFMWAVSMYQMWLGKTPSPVEQRPDRDKPGVG